MLLEPARQYLHAEGLAIVADGALQFVPFGALALRVCRSFGITKSCSFLQRRRWRCYGRRRGSSNCTKIRGHLPGSRIHG